MQKRALGDQIEAAACRHLKNAGLIPLAQQAAFRFGEVDLIMQEGNTVVFVEVRYRQNQSFGGGAASVTRSKQRRLMLAAQAWLASTPVYSNQPCRFDVISASGAPEAPHLEWIRGAFSLDDLA